jgi:hypothetical protein
MLALRRRSPQVVVTNEKFHGPDMVGELLGTRSRVADQSGHALPQRGVAPFDVMGLPGYLADRFVWHRGHPLRIYPLLIRVQWGVLTVGVRNLGPQVLGACGANRAMTLFTSLGTSADCRGRT